MKGICKYLIVGTCLCEIDQSYCYAREDNQDYGQWEFDNCGSYEEQEN